ncbi:DUF6882 domain-containing protein [Streptomyces sp. NPDC002221]|uniref:DUF6882 domain-containing protein n=1 Tax=Streptomyces sp. NPDC002221 TaxID=3364639 RepID=UPI0036824042
MRGGLPGSYDTAEKTWLWGWANPGLRSSAVVAASERIGESGRRRGVAELVQQGVDLADFTDPRQAVEALAFTGAAVLGAPGYLGHEAGPNAPGARAHPRRGGAYVNASAGFEEAGARMRSGQSLSA